VISHGIGATGRPTTPSSPTIGPRMGGDARVQWRSPSDDTVGDADETDDAGGRLILGQTLPPPSQGERETQRDDQECTRRRGGSRSPRLLLPSHARPLVLGEFDFHFLCGLQTPHVAPQPWCFERLMLQSLPFSSAPGHFSAPTASPPSPTTRSTGRRASCRPSRSVASSGGPSGRLAFSIACATSGFVVRKLHQADEGDGAEDDAEEHGGHTDDDQDSRVVLLVGLLHDRRAAEDLHVEAVRMYG